MNIRTRVQVDGFVTGVSRRLVYYPACDSCAGKLTILQDNSKYLMQVCISPKYIYVVVGRYGARIGVRDAAMQWKRKTFIIDIV